MADTYPRVFLPDASFDAVAGTVNPAVTDNNAERVDGDPPSQRSHLSLLDPLVRWYTGGRDGARSYTWTFTHASSSARRVNAVAFLGYYLAAQAIRFDLRDAADRNLETVALEFPTLAGIPSLGVVEAAQARSVRSVRYRLSQPRSRRTVVAFALAGVVEQLGRSPYQHVRRPQNRPVIIDPYSAPIDQGEYDRLEFAAEDVSDGDLALVEKWSDADELLVELARGDWRIGVLRVQSIAVSGGRSNVRFVFRERLL